MDEKAPQYSTLGGLRAEEFHPPRRLPYGSSGVVGALNPPTLEAKAFMQPDKTKVDPFQSVEKNSDQAKVGWWLIIILCKSYEKDECKTGLSARHHYYELFSEHQHQTI